MEDTSKSITLIGFPFSGASFICYKPLEPYLHPQIRFNTIELPGRGKRVRSPLLRNMDEICEDAWTQVKAFLNPPYALFGHSLGSLLVYLLSHKIKDSNHPLPCHLFLSGRKGPSIPKSEKIHLLPQNAFKEKLKNLGGIPKEVLENQGLFSFFEPILRADFEAVENWTYSPRPKLNIPVTVINGKEDNMTEMEVKTWQNEFEPTVNFKFLDGDHFFLFRQALEFTDIINKTLSN